MKTLQKCADLVPFAPAGTASIAPVIRAVYHWINSDHETRE